VPFSDRFQLLDLKRDEGARTFEAREISTGRPVLVHLFADRTSPLNRALLEKLDALPDAERRRVIDRGEHQGGLYVVTDRLADYPGLREWLSAKSADRPQSLDLAGAWKIPPVKKPSVDDQLANLFDTAPRPVLAPSAAEPEPVPPLTNSGEVTLKMPTPVEPPPPTVDPAAPAPQEAGEFTRQFAPVVRPAAQPPKEPPPITPAPPASEPGEFTRQFTPPPVLRPPAPQAPKEPPVPKETPPVAPAPAASDPGEFTRQFAPPVLRAAPVSTRSPTPPPQDPGEFTRQFAAPPPTTPPSPKPEPPPGEFTRQFQQRPIVAAAAPRTPAPSQPASQQSSQPGEFTQMLQAQRPAAPVTPPNLPSQSDEFGRFFQSPMTPAAHSTPPPTPLQPPSQPRGAGEFTQIFGRGDMPSPPPPPLPAAPPAPPSSGNATQVFAAPRGPAPMPAPNVNPQGPGEYTRMFSTPAPLTFGQSPAGPQKVHLPEAAPPKRNKSRLPLFLVIGAVGLLIVALIVFLLMRQRPT